jgi:hypothetical protein
MDHDLAATRGPENLAGPLRGLGLSAVMRAGAARVRIADIPAAVRIPYDVGLIPTAHRIDLPANRCLHEFCLKTPAAGNSSRRVATTPVLGNSHTRPTISRRADRRSEPAASRARKWSSLRNGVDVLPSGSCYVLTAREQAGLVEPVQACAGSLNLDIEPVS